MKRLRKYRLLFEDGTTKQFFTEIGARWYLSSLSQQMDIDDIIYGGGREFPNQTYLNASVQRWSTDRWVSIY